MGGYSESKEICGMLQRVKRDLWEFTRPQVRGQLWEVISPSQRRFLECYPVRGDLWEVTLSQRFVGAYHEFKGLKRLI